MIHPEDDGLTPATCRAMRGWLHWHQNDLARHAGLSMATIVYLEQGEKKGWKVRPENRRAILLAFQRAGVRVLMMNGEIRGLKFTPKAPTLLLKHEAPAPSAGP